MPIIAPLAMAGEPGREEADAVHGGHPATDTVDLRLRALGDHPARRGAAVPAGGRAGPGGGAPGAVRSAADAIR